MSRLNSVNVNYPYPIFEEKDNEFEVKETLCCPRKNNLIDPYIITFNIKMFNQDIQNLISQGKAEYMCEILCSATLLRKCYKTSDDVLEIKIGRKEICGRCECRLLVIAKERIQNYTNSKAHPDFKELEPFDIACGYPLALLKTKYFDTDVCFEDMRSLKSFVQLLENENNKNEDKVIVDTDNDNINIFLPSQQYHNIQESHQQDNKIVSDIVMSSYLLFALTVALHHYHQNSEKKWARILARIVRNTTEIADIELDQMDENDIVKVVQVLLKNPLKDLSNDIPNIATFLQIQNDNMDAED